MGWTAVIMTTILIMAACGCIGPILTATVTASGIVNCCAAFAEYAAFTIDRLTMTIIMRPIIPSESGWTRSASAFCVLLSAGCLATGEDGHMQGFVITGVVLRMMTTSGRILKNDIIII